MLADAPARELEPVVRRVRLRRDHVEHAAAVLVLLWWAGPMTARQGGRGAGATAIALALVVVLLLAAAPWRRVPTVVLAFALAVPSSALVVALTAPTGWYGADDLASYTLAALTVPAFLAYARSAERRRFVVAAISLAGLAEFAEAFLPWWGGGDPSRPMIGTFYWWNPYAAYLLPGALLGVALAVRGGRPWRVVGWIAGPVCAAGIVFSSSRTTTALLGAGMLAMVLLCAPREGRKQHLARWIAVCALAGVATFALAGPPFFSHRQSVTAAAQVRADRGETLSANGEYRLQFWKRAVAVFEHHPVVGAGPHGLLGASNPLVPADYARSNLAHNGYLQALADGGLVLALPFLLAVAGLLGAGLRRLRSAVTTDDERWLRVALPVTLLASCAHSVVDFDWSHPSDLVLTALLGALVLALPVRRARAAKVPAWLFSAPAVVLAGVFFVAAWHWDNTQLDVGRVTGTPAQQAHQLRQLGSQPLRDHRWAVRLLQLGAGGSGSITSHGVAPSDLRWAVQSTSAIGPVDATIQLERTRALVLLGRQQQAVALVDHLIAALGPARAGAVADLAAQTLNAGGRHVQARQLVVQYLRAGDRDAHAGAHLDALLALEDGQYDVVDQCAYAAVDPALRPTATPDPGAPVPGTDCESVLQGAVS